MSGDLDNADNSKWFTPQAESASSATEKNADLTRVMQDASGHDKFLPASVLTKKITVSGSSSLPGLNIAHGQPSSIISQEHDVIAVVPDNGETLKAPSEECYNCDQQKIPNSKLKGIVYKIPGMIEKKIKFIKRNIRETEKLRKEFSSVRKNWMKTYADHPDLIKAGLTEKDFVRMRAGVNPKGYQLHHIIPLEDSGTNDNKNLVLMRLETEHKLMNNMQNSQVKGMAIGEVRYPIWIVPKTQSLVWPPSQELSAYPTK